MRNRTSIFNPSLFERSSFEMEQHRLVGNLEHALGPLMIGLCLLRHFLPIIFPNFTGVSLIKSDFCIDFRL